MSEQAEAIQRDRRSTETLDLEQKPSRHEYGVVVEFARLLGEQFSVLADLALVAVPSVVAKFSSQILYPFSSVCSGSSLPDYPVCLRVADDHHL